MRVIEYAVVFALGLLIATLAREPRLAKVQLWWVKNDPHRGRDIDGHNVMTKELELRTKIGPILASVTPGYGTCGHCAAPWSMVEGHSIAYTDHSSVFALCEQCFKTLRTLGRDEEIIAAYVAAVRAWKAPDEAQIIAGLMQGLGTELHGPRMVSVPTEAK